MELNSGLVVTMEEKTCDPASEPFKKPAQMCLIGPRKGKGVSVRKVDTEVRVEDSKQDKIPALPPFSSETASNEGVVGASCGSSKKEEVEGLDVPETDTINSKKPAAIIPAQKLKETPIPYLEPKWGGIPEEQYSLDVIKAGSIVSSISLNKKSFHVFGRQTNCDVQMAHPTVSRHHSVLQYSMGSKEKPKGFYVYDLRSTHGTFLNKNRICSEMFAPVKVGHQIKIGASSRIYLLQGPTEDMEEESEFTVTELKAQRQLKLQEREFVELERKRKEEEEKQKRENEGIDWGMGDDADEETDLSENPYAVTSNEDLYVDDPKKTLRGWFDREGHELEYDIEEKGPGQFLCRVEVPVEGARRGSMTAEALVKGKKKEAVVQCALEACRLLDRLGLLRQATHESRKRKAKNWEEDDFYDSDDDTFLDRTGSVEKKRQQRMQQAGKAEVQVETFESLSKKHAEVLERLKFLQTQLDKALADLASSTMQESNEEEIDPLDSFMSNLTSKGCPDKKQINKLKGEISNLQKEEVQVRKLVNIARPANLPELISPATSGESSEAKDLISIKNKLMLCARKKTSFKQGVLAETSSQVNVGGKNDEEEKAIKDEEQSDHIHFDKDMKSSTHGFKCTETANPTKNEPVGTEEKSAVLGPIKPTFLDESSSNRCLEKDDEPIEDQTSDTDDIGQKDVERRKKRNRRRLLQRNEKAEKSKSTYDSSDPNYSVWVPPDDQSGDGKTKLNEKLGY